MVREFEVNDVGEALLHKLGDDLAKRRRAEILSLLYDIVVGGDGGYRRRVGGRAADALFLHGADKRGLGIARGGLGELLVGHHFFKIHLLPLGKAGQGVVYLGALLVLRFLIHGGITGELHFGIVRAEGVPGADCVHGNVVINGVCHLAGREAAPDEPVKPVLLL